MTLEFFISSNGTIQDESGEQIACLGSESAAADFCIRLAQDAGADRYTLHYGKVAR